MSAPGLPPPPPPPPPAPPVAGRSASTWWVVGGFGLLVVIALVAAVFVLADGDSSPVDRGSAGASPAVTDHWHAAYGVSICGEFEPPFVSLNDPSGIHSHSDGVIHIHPFFDAVAGDAATLGVFFDAMDASLADDRLDLGAASDGAGRTFTEGGDTCDGEDAVLRVARWARASEAADTEPEVFIEDLSDINFENDGEAYTIAFGPDSADLEPPPTIPRLDALSGLGPSTTEVPPPLEGAAFPFGTGPCAPAERPATPRLEFPGAPKDCLDQDTRYTAVFDTTEGEIRVDLDPDEVPGTVNNFVTLAEWGYYDGTLLFRTDPSTDIVQGGAPRTNDGTDPGPGYTIPDERGGFTYEPGQLVMARTADQNSASAQFFFTAGPDASVLDAQGTHVVFGNTDADGLAVLEEILALHRPDPDNPLGGAPSRDVTVRRVTIERS